jgi:signal transduction histidine kinase
VATAAERALDESRRAISALSSETPETFEAAVAQAAEDVAHRVGVRVRLALESGVVMPAPEVEDVLRIVREAVTNAARHGEADEVRIALQRGDESVLRITDNGRGFAPSDNGHGFGLTTMRERAARIGGTVSVDSMPGRGTTVELKWT